VNLVECWCSSCVWSFSRARVTVASCCEPKLSNRLGYEEQLYFEWNPAQGVGMLFGSCLRVVWSTARSIYFVEVECRGILSQWLFGGDLSELPMYQCQVFRVVSWCEPTTYDEGYPEFRPSDYFFRITKHLRLVIALPRVNFQRTCHSDFSCSLGGIITCCSQLVDRKKVTFHGVILTSFAFSNCWHVPSSGFLFPFVVIAQ